MRRAIALAALLVGAFIGGCHHEPTAAFVGKWRMHRLQPPTDPKQQAAYEFTQLMELDVKPDHTFDWTSNGKPYKSGVWEAQTALNVVFEPKTMWGKSFDDLKSALSSSEASKRAVLIQELDADAQPISAMCQPQPKGKKLSIYGNRIPYLISDEPFPTN